jgi:hypothetical protein
MKEEIKQLQEIKNWTEREIYIHRTRLILGFLIGLALGILI